MSELQNCLVSAAALLLKADELNRELEVSAPLHNAMFFLAVAASRAGCPGLEEAPPSPGPEAGSKLQSGAEDLGRPSH